MQPASLYFVPQRPYIKSGSLREQVLYPLSPGDECQEEDMRIEVRFRCSLQVDNYFIDACWQWLLSRLGLHHLLQRRGGLNAIENWADSLSVGEQQRLGFARLFYHKPRFAILDEATSALDVPLEKLCMQMCGDYGITCISVGHRPTLLPFHSMVLTLKGHATYSVEKVGKLRTRHGTLTACLPGYRGISSGNIERSRASAPGTSRTS